MNYITVRISMLLFLIIFSPMILAKHVLPVFSGKWYTNCEKVMEEDSCSQSQYVYDKFVPGATGAEAAAILLGNLPKRSDCEWQKIMLMLDWPFFPRDFHRVANEKDWDIIYQSKLGPNPQRWVRWCISPESHGFVDGVSVAIEPFYECPVGSRYDYLDLDDKVRGCSTHPTLCNADIVGRDLDFSSQADAVGHIGFAMYPQNVLEVLKEDAVIQINTLDNFKQKTTYWGAKYGLEQYPVLSLDQSYNIILAAYKQRDCKTIRYTPTWNWHACQVDPDTGEENAVFRCDSFVYNGYVTGAGIKILDYKFGVLPADIFNTFLGCRFNVGDLGSHCSGGGKVFNDSFTTKILYGGQSLQEDNLRTIFSYSGLDIKNTDIATYHYVNDMTIPRTEKINFLWQLAKKYQAGETHFNYIIDCLKYLKPIELTDRLIDEFYISTDVQHKKYILQCLGELAGKSALKAYVTMAIEVEANITKIHNFYRQVIQHATNIEILETAILFYPTIFSSEALQDIEKACSRIDIDADALKERLTSNPSYFTSQLAMIFSNQQLQKQFLPQLLREIKPLDIRRKNVFNESLYNYFNDEDFYPPKHGFDVSKISNEVRPLLIQYLEQQQPPIFKVNHLPDFSPISLDNLRYNWLETYFAVQSYNMAEKYSKLARYIRDTDNLSYKSLLLFYATKTVYDQFSCQDLWWFVETLDENKKITNLSSKVDKQEEFAHEFKRMSLGKIKRFLYAKCKV